MYFSPKTSADGLVFHYDTGNTVRSYLGEPTTNLNPYTLSDSGTDGSGQGSVGTRTILSSNHVRIVDVDSNTRQTHLIQGLTGGTTYTISVEFKKLSGTPTFRFQIQDHSGGSYLRTIKFTDTSEIGIEDKEGWQRAFWTFTLGGDANAVRIWYQDGADYTTYTHAFELRNPQLEAKSHPTPFTPPSTTRSTTQGLKDLTAANTVNLSNVSFDANAQMTFDGTDDFISLGNNFAFERTQAFSIEFIIKAGIPTTYLPVVNKLVWAAGAKGYRILSDYQGAGLTFTIADNHTVTDTYINIPSVLNNQYRHIVFTYNGNGNTNGMQGFRDGTLYTSGGGGNLGSTTIATTEFGIFGGSGTYNTGLGELPVLKIYNRALTADEVARNFNAIKSRFNIG